MYQYIAKRLLWAVPVVVGVSILIFSMMHLVPGDPVDIMTAEQKPSPEVREALRRQLGLHLPIHIQYLNWAGSALKGDLGRSIRSNRPVVQEIGYRYFNTVKLAVASIIIAGCIGIVLGVISAARKDSIIDNVTRILALIGVSMPSFWMGLLLILLFAVRLGWLPVAGSDTPQHLVLPAFTLGVGSAAILARMTRSSLLDVLQEDYVTTARAKGLHSRIVLYKHALRNAFIPVITMMGLQFGYLLGGAFVIEVVFAYNGLGAVGVRAILARDFPLVQGAILVDALTIVAVNVVVDLLYAVLDPRIAYS
ncbi:MAG: ABC transporter permease [Bacillota bacterium]